MNLRLVLFILAGILAGGVAALALIGLPDGAVAPAGQVVATGKAAIGGPFSLVDQSGKRVSEKDFAGRRLLVYFGFTNCPDVCPSGLQIISAALDRLGSKADKIAPVFITLDPERDTPQVLGEYLKSFSPRLVGLSGTAEETAAVAKAYRVYFAKVALEGSGGGYNVDHSSFMYLMDGSGQFIQHFPHSVTVDKLAEALANGL